MENLKAQASAVMNQLLLSTKLEKGDIIVIGCSTSEIGGSIIGSSSNLNIAEEIFECFYDPAAEKGIFLAFQCCEHLNRALIVEKECARIYGLEEVNVIPQIKAGGSMATTAYKHFVQPVAVEAIKAHAGIDIGDTLIGMHLRPVAVPLRSEHNKIGEAHIVMARTRKKFVGGTRAIYDNTLL